MTFYSISVANANNSKDDTQLLPLRSVLMRDSDVFASNATGLYRAELSSKTWKRLVLPDSMPIGGYFANQPTNSKLILYYTPKWTTDKNTNAKTKISGLYLSQDSGQTWRLVSKNDDYGPVFLHPNGNIYAVTNAGRFMGPAHIFISKNLGESWRDISGKSFGEIMGIFADPDHPGLICLSANSMRNYVFQATDENYNWQATREWNWWPKHQTKERFFARDYSTRTTLYMLHATLANYFAHDFGKDVALPGFDIVSEKGNYAFSKNQPKIIQVSVLFLPESRTAKIAEKNGQGSWSMSPPSSKIEIADQKEGLGLWGLSIISPDGKMTYVQPADSKMVYGSEDQTKAKQHLRETEDFKVHEVNHAKPYQRTIDLAKLYDFAIPGTYQVQLAYSNIWFDDRSQGEWVGSFRSQVFTITIK